MQRYNKIFEFPNFSCIIFKKNDAHFMDIKCKEIKGNQNKESFQLKKTFWRNFSFVRKRKIIYKKKKNHKPLRFAVAIFFYTRTMMRVVFIYPLPGVWERRIDASKKRRGYGWVLSHKCPINWRKTQKNPYFCIFFEILTTFSSLLQYLCSGFQKSPLELLKLLKLF